MRGVEKKIKKILLTWLNAEFQGGRHARRINKIEKIEKNTAMKSSSSYKICAAFISILYC